jgi:hypothetical protein
MKLAFHPKLLDNLQSIVNIQTLMKGYYHMSSANSSSLIGNYVPPYTNKDDLLLDYNLYLKFYTNDILTLNLFPQIAASRWTYIVSQWDARYNLLFKNAVGGDGYLLDGYTQLVNAVYASKLDSQYNPLNSITFYSQVKEFLELITIESLKPTPLEQDIIAKERQRVLGFGIPNFRAMLSYLKTEKDNAYDLIGLGNTTYDTRVGRTPLSQQRDFFLSDLLNIGDILTLEASIQGCIVTLKRKTQRDPNLIAYSNSQIDATSNVRLSDIYVSYNLIPFEVSLENMAIKYLGDVQKVYEIASINKLKAPFVDTAGIRISLQGNGTGLSVRIANTYPERYRVGSIVKVGSRVIPETTRKVLRRIDNDQDNSTVLFLSGDSNLNFLLSSQGAYVRAFAPDTLQDFSFVRIPSTVASKTPVVIQPSNSEIKKLDEALLAFGVDISVSEYSRDWETDQTGNLKLAYGLGNVAQAVKSAIRTPLGTLNHHPSYGYFEYTGDQFTDDVPVKVAGLMQAAVLRDPRFISMSVNNLTVSESGEIIVSSSVKIAGTDQNIPLNLNLT